MAVPITILDGASTYPLNHSEYVLDPAKVQSRPPGVEETDGYREVATNEDMYTQRIYYCPWSQYRTFRLWALGYSYTETVKSELQKAGQPDPAQDAKVAQAVAFNAQAPPDPTLVWPPDTHELRRILPAQDHKHPWLFARDFELMRGEGAWVDDPDNDVLDVNGEKVFTADPVPKTIPAGGICYVDNSESGGSVLPGGGSLDAGKPSGRFRDGRAKIRVTYRPRNYALLSDAAFPFRGVGELGRYVVREEKYNIEAVPLARLAATTGAPLTFAEGPAGVTGVRVPEAGIQLLPTTLLTYTWLEVPDRPLSAYASCVGKINAAAFDGVGGSPTYPAETLLCQPWQTKRVNQATGRVAWNITFSFFFRPQKWNRFPTAYGGFFLATFGGKTTDERVYKSADFGTLFRVPPPAKYV